MRYPLAGTDMLAALATGSGLAAGAIGLAKAVAKRAPGILALPLAVGGGLMWLGRNLGDAYVEVGDDSVQIKLGVLFDEKIALSDISRVRETRWNILGGLGIRTNLTDMVAVVTKTGPVAELSLWRPLRMPVIPHIYHVRAQRLLVSPENLDAFISEVRGRLAS
jgi:hypothetical protein